MMAEDRLPVQLYGTRIGDLARRADGRAALVWHPDAAARWKLRATPLSQSLPVGVDDPAATEAFFGALLPEGQWLDRLSRELHVAGNDVIGLLHHESWVDTVGGMTALVVERYDRRVTAADVERIHQEDFAQALALPWGGDDKFQRNNPAANLAAIAALLDQDRTIFDRRERETERLLRAVTLNVAVGNTDAHAKNLSLLRFETGGTALAPYYDGSPLALRYGARQAMAMTVAGVWDINDVTVEHLVQEAVGWGISAVGARVVVMDTLDRIVEASHALPAHESIVAHVPGYIRGRAQNLADGLPARLDLPVLPGSRIGQ